MRAMTYQGAHKVQVDTVPDPIIEQPDDIILRVTATAICGSDLHCTVARSRPWSMAISSAMSSWASSKNRPGRHCGATRRPCGDSVRDCLWRLFFCQLQQFAACETTNDGRGAILNKSHPTGAALFGYSRLYGGIPGGQAEG